MHNLCHNVLDGDGIRSENIYNGIIFKIRCLVVLKEVLYYHFSYFGESVVMMG